MKKYHYTYWLSSAPNENYIGVRSCKCKPQDDTEYMSSSKIVKQMIAEGKKFHKHILKVWPTRKEAVEHEVLMHRVLDVGRNPLFLNKARQTSTGFDVSGMQCSTETRARMSAVRAGEKNPMYGRTGDKHPMYGKQCSAETRARMSAARKGRKLSAETRAKISVAQKGKYAGDKNPMWGKSHSAESLAKMLVAARNRSPETRAKISAAKTGDKHPMAQAVYDNETGITYNTIKECCEAIGRSKTYIHYHPERFKITKTKKEKRKYKKRK